MTSLLHVLLALLGVTARASASEVIGFLSEDRIPFVISGGRLSVLGHHAGLGGEYHVPFEVAGVSSHVRAALVYGEPACVAMWRYGGESVDSLPGLDKKIHINGAAACKEMWIVYGRSCESREHVELGSGFRRWFSCVSEVPSAGVVYVSTDGGAKWGMLCAGEREFFFADLDFPHLSLLMADGRILQLTVDVVAGAQVLEREVGGQLPPPTGNEYMLFTTSPTLGAYYREHHKGIKNFRPDGGSFGWCERSVDVELNHIVGLVHSADGVLYVRNRRELVSKGKEGIRCSQEFDSNVVAWGVSATDEVILLLESGSVGYIDREGCNVQWILGR